MTSPGSERREKKVVKVVQTAASAGLTLSGSAHTEHCSSREALSRAYPRFLVLELSGRSLDLVVPLLSWWFMVMLPL